MIRVPLTEDALRAAMNRLSDFKSVHDGKEDYVEAFTVLRESLGLTDDRLLEYQEGMAEILDSDDSNLAAGTIIGLLVGLIAADYAL